MEIKDSTVNKIHCKLTWVFTENKTDWESETNHDFVHDEAQHDLVRQGTYSVMGIGFCNIGYHLEIQFKQQSCTFLLFHNIHFHCEIIFTFYKRLTSDIVMCKTSKQFAHWEIVYGPTRFCEIWAYGGISCIATAARP